MNDDKRRHRQLKRDVKKAGNRKRRRHFDRQLQRNPEEAHEAEFDFGRDSSASFNGNDQDATRQREPDEPVGDDHS
jgi:hypothetical protein